MKFVEHYKGFEIFTEDQNGVETFFICMDTPDGLIRCKQNFEEILKVRNFVEQGKFSN